MYFYIIVFFSSMLLIPLSVFYYMQTLNAVTITAFAIWFALSTFWMVLFSYLDTFILIRWGRGWREIK